MTTAFIVLSVLFIVREIITLRERKDLYNRIMAKDLTEYQQIDKPPPKPLRSKFSIIKQRRSERDGLN
jgi:hypothetical protein